LIVPVGENGNSEQEGQDCSKELADKPDHFVLILSRKVKTRTLQKPKHAAPESRPAVKGLPPAFPSAPAAEVLRLSERIYDISGHYSGMVSANRMVLRAPTLRRTRRPEAP
jgi:hypothetical protein